MDIQSAYIHMGQVGRNTPRLDSQLIVQIGQRDEQALGTLYDRYGALVYTIAVRITQEPTLAETIVQDVFYAVWQLASSFQVGVSVPAWLLGLARARAIDALQHRSSRARPQMAAHTKTHAPRRGEQGAEALDVCGVLDTLPADQRETVELAYYDRLTCDQIAARLHQPVSIIETRLRLGLCALSEALSNGAAQLRHL
jgi:RNA polymerase sigma-70 factor (ECF subfamily)